MTHIDRPAYLPIRVLDTSDDLQQQVAMHSMLALARALQYSEMVRVDTGVPRNVPFRSRVPAVGSELAARYELQLARTHTLTGSLVRASVQSDYVAEANLSEDLTRAEAELQARAAEMRAVSSGRGHPECVSGLYYYTVGAVELTGAIQAELTAVPMWCVTRLAGPELRQPLQDYLSLDPDSPGAYGAPWRYNKTKRRYCRNERVDEWIRELLIGLWASPASEVA